MNLYKYERQNGGNDFIVAESIFECEKLVNESGDSEIIKIELITYDIKIQRNE